MQEESGMECSDCFLVPANVTINGATALLLQGSAGEVQLCSAESPLMEANICTKWLAVPTATHPRVQKLEKESTFIDDSDGVDMQTSKV